MRKLFVVGFASLFLLTAAMTTGCNSKTATPTPKMMDPPKEGPQPVGGPVGGPKGKGGGGVGQGTPDQ